MSQTFLIEWPPSANAIWRAVGGRNILSLRYRQWRDTAGKQLLAQKVKRIKGPVSIDIGLCCPTKHKWDLDNRIKPVLDLLVSNSIIDGDDAGTVKLLRVWPSESFVGAQVTVTSA